MSCSRVHYCSHLAACGSRAYVVSNVEECVPFFFPNRTTTQPDIDHSYLVLFVQQDLRPAYFFPCCDPTWIYQSKLTRLGSFYPLVFPGTHVYPHLPITQILGNVFGTGGDEYRRSRGYNDSWLIA